jgi:hypothetical protein
LIAAGNSNEVAVARAASPGTVRAIAVVERRTPAFSDMMLNELVEDDIMTV